MTQSYGSDLAQPASDEQDDGVVGGNSMKLEILDRNQFE